MKALIKFILRLFGSIPGMKTLWLNAMRFILARGWVSTKMRDMIMWDLATYVLGSYEEIVKLSTGPTMRVGATDQISRLALFYLRRSDYLWEPQTLRLALRMLGKGQASFIAGAHVGYHALHLAQATPGQVFAFEPLQEFFNRANLNKELSLYKNLKIEHMALSAQQHEQIILFAAGSRSSIEVPLDHSGSHQEIVSAISLDEYARLHNIATADLIFLDIEGSELNVLLGATNLLRSHPILVLEVNRSGLSSLGYSPNSLYKFLFDHGYQVFYIEDDYFFQYAGYLPQKVVLHPVWSDDVVFHANLRAFNIMAIASEERFAQLKSDALISFHSPIGKK